MIYLFIIIMMSIILSPLLYVKRAKYHKFKQFGIDSHASVNHKYDGKPYSVHLKLVHKYGKRYIYLLGNLSKYKIEHILGICWLHDLIEDCRLTYNDVKSYCGYMAAEIVFALSNEKGKFRRDRANNKYYDDMKKVDYAVFIKLCDRLANIEYSKRKSSGMFNVYKNEHAEFRKKLYEPRFAAMFFDMEIMLGIN